MFYTPTSNNSSYRAKNNEIKAPYFQILYVPNSHPHNTRGVGYVSRLTYDDIMIYVVMSICPIVKHDGVYLVEAQVDVIRKG